MTLNELLEIKEIEIPLSINTNDIVKNLESKFIDYISFLKSISKSKIDDADISISDIEIGECDDLCNALIATITQYLNGYPAEAYQNLERTLINIKDLVDFFALIGRNKGTTPIQNIFRLRRPNEVRLERKEIFHVPINNPGAELRGMSSVYSNNFNCLST